MENISGDAQDDYFADGMTDALITDLGRVGALRVISRTSVMGYKKTNKTLPEIGRELNVDAIVEGTVLRTGDRVRITAQLLHAPTDRHLWAQSYERALQDILALQSEVARAIATEVMAKVTAQEQARLSKAERVQPGAYLAYLNGTVGPTAAALESFEQALQLDPDFAPAYAGLGSRYYALFGELQPDISYARMKDAALKALEKDNELSDAYDLLGLVRFHQDWNWADAERNFRRALELNPSSARARHSYAHYLLAMGRGQESVTESERAAGLDPLNPTLTACQGWHQLFASQYDGAIEHAQQAIQMNPAGLFGYLVLGWGCEQKSMMEPAITAFEQAVARARGRPIATASLGHALALSGRRQEAQKLLAGLRDLSQRSYVPGYDVATIYAGLKDPDSTFEWLDKAFQERSSFLVHINWDPRFKVLRSDPRFGKLLQQIGLPRS